jgi:hypothetical protein
MDKLSLPQIFRHLLMGFIWMVGYYICFPTNTKEFFSALSEAKIPDSVLATGIPILALVIGTLTFLIYRSLIYGLIILKLIDRIWPDNVRSFLKEKYKISGWYKADALWKAIREKKLSEQTKNVDLGSAGIHLLFMSALTVFVLSICLFIDDGWVPKFWLSIAAFIIFVAVAMESDFHMQTIEFHLLKSIKPVELDKLVATILNNHDKEE